MNFLSIYHQPFLHHFFTFFSTILSFFIFWTVLEKSRNRRWWTKMATIRKLRRYSLVMWRYHLILRTTKEAIELERLSFNFHWHSFNILRVTGEVEGNYSLSFSFFFVYFSLTLNRIFFLSCRNDLHFKNPMVWCGTDLWYKRTNAESHLHWLRWEKCKPYGIIWLISCSLVKVIMKCLSVRC